jgi:hypothetical protein
MISLKIEEQKTFTSELFIGNIFDSFLVREVSITTFNTFTIDGRVRQGYYSDEELEENKIEEFSSWKALKPFCFSLIKGKRLPESFRIVLLLAPAARERFVKKHAPSLLPEQVGGLYLNIQYENGTMTCVTGTSLNVFTMDKSLDREWDEAVMQFLTRNMIAFLY